MYQLHLPPHTCYKYKTWRQLARIGICGNGAPTRRRRGRCMTPNCSLYQWTYIVNVESQGQLLDLTPKWKCWILETGLYCERYLIGYDDFVRLNGIHCVVHCFRQTQWLYQRFSPSNIVTFCRPWFIATPSLPKVWHLGYWKIRQSLHFGKIMPIKGKNCRSPQIQRKFLNWLGKWEDWYAVSREDIAWYRGSLLLSNYSIHSRYYSLCNPNMDGKVGGSVSANWMLGGYKIRKALCFLDLPTTWERRATNQIDIQWWLCRGFTSTNSRQRGA